MSATFVFEKTRNLDGSSDPIDPTDLATGRTAYSNRKDKLYVKDAAGNLQVLKGLRFDAGDIQQILDQEDCTHLFLIFIESPANKDNITVAVTGIFPDENDPNGRLDYDSKMFDYCEPCPNKCPSNM